MKLTVNVKDKNYDILIEEGILNKVSSFVEQGRNVAIVTDDGVPDQYVNAVMKQFRKCYLYVFPHGEKSKNFTTYQRVLHFLLDHNISKKDYVIALGGGVVGDLTGFAAATYKRGVRFINIPTTTLSMVDSSIGGKVAVNFEKLKNHIGTYYQPEVVIIDPKTLETLPKRHINNGAIEALKTGLIGDKELFEIFKKGEYLEKIKEVIYRSLCVKASVVEQDEKENNIRKILNFGHTFGHAYESYFKMNTYLHGESIALGMLTVSRDETYFNDLLAILKKMKINLKADVEEDKIIEFIKNDKKSDGKSVDVIFVREIGKAEIVNIPIKSLRAFLRRDV